MRFITAGESHGHSLVGILEGLPSGFSLDVAHINTMLFQRQSGYGRSSRMSLEKDSVLILAGIIDGKTCGAPVCLSVQNRDNRKLDESSGEPHLIPRPGHVDLPGSIKYGLSDMKIPAERASARTTAILVALGAVALQMLRHFGIQVLGWVSQIGDIASREKDYTIDEIESAVLHSPLRCPDSEIEPSMTALIDECRGRGDSLGGIITVMAEGAPPGLGSFVHWDRRLDGRLASAIMSIPAIKGFEIGRGFLDAGRQGSQVHDSICWDGGYKRSSNRAGGLEGGVTNGEPIILRAAMKPIPTLKKGIASVDVKTRKSVTAEYVRSDVCAVPAASVVAESMTALCLLEAFLEKFGGDTAEEVMSALTRYREYIKAF
ncbi:MAG: chorismate synthase [Candidatus Xenobiia bacterium LiM19]